MKVKRNYKRYLFWLILISFVVRAFFAAFLELGNDEVYYRLYALYPDWSHFDHPLMVGLVIQLFSLNLLLHSEFFLRLSSLIFGCINLWIVFQIGKTLKDEQTGFYAALLYTASIYAFVITGIFILPDTPQSLFWLLSLWAMLKAFPFPENNIAKKYMLWFGIFAGLAILSKYTSIFLWFGAGLYIILYRRKWFAKKELYLAILLSFVIALPILIWNIQNHFISFVFHSQRIDMLGYSFNSNTFLTEVAGEILYNNPINFVLILLTLVAAFKQRLLLNKNYQRLILLVALPIILLFLTFSLFRNTLPHWTAPAYNTLIFLTAVWLSQKKSSRKIPVSLSASLVLIALVLVLGFAQINFGLFNIDSSLSYNKIGSKDPSLDMYGYRQVGKAFSKIVKRDKISGVMTGNIIMVGDNWFPLANLDYYAATPLHIKSFAIGPLEKIHKYAWINNINGGFRIGMNAYYITDTRYYNPPSSNLKSYFEKTETADTIQIFRGAKIAKRVFVFRLINLKKIPEDVLKKI